MNVWVELSLNYKQSQDTPCAKKQLIIALQPGSSHRWKTLWHSHTVSRASALRKVISGVTLVTWGLWSLWGVETCVMEIHCPVLLKRIVFLTLWTKPGNKGCRQKTVNGLFDFTNVPKDLRAKATYNSHTNYFVAAFSIYLRLQNLLWIGNYKTGTKLTLEEQNLLRHQRKPLQMLSVTRRESLSPAGNIAPSRQRAQWGDSGSLKKPLLFPPAEYQMWLNRPCNDGDGRRGKNLLARSPPQLCPMVKLPPSPVSLAMSLWLHKHAVHSEFHITDAAWSMP